MAQSRSMNARRKRTSPRAARAGALLLILSAWSISAAAQAGRENSGTHAGVGVARISFEDRYRGAAYDDASIGWQAYAGYRMSDRISAEIAHKSFGRIDARDVPGSGIERLDISAQLDVSIIRAAVDLPLSEVLPWKRGVWVFGTAGLHRSRVRRDGMPTGGGVGHSDSASDSGLAFGGGVLVELGRFELRGYFERFETRRIAQARDAGVAVQLRF